MIPKKSNLAFLLLLVFSCPVVHAEECRCPPLTPLEEMEQANTVFNGRVSAILTDKISRQRAIVFDVVDSFKGNPPDEVKLADEQQGRPCESSFQEGNLYLVYTRWTWGFTQTSRCWGTKPIDQTRAVEKTLGPADAEKEKIYNLLQKHCMGRYDTPCCVNSVKVMRKNYFLPEPADGCPSGMKPDTLRCIGSLRWCIPVAEEYKPQ